MKTSRGSGRASTRGPRGTAGRKTNKSKPSAADSHPGQSQKSGAVARNNKSQQSWKPLTKSSLLALENMLGLSVLSVLTLKSKEKDESQNHLNRLKNQPKKGKTTVFLQQVKSFLHTQRFLAQCAQLSVPPRKYGDIVKVSYQFKAESKKSEQGKKTFETLEENMRSIVDTLEEMEVKMDSLKEKCRMLRSRIEEEEENAQEILQLSKQSVLNLPALPPRPANELSLQEHMMKMVPNPSAVVKALQTDPVVDDVRTFLTLAHKQVDADRDTPLE